MNNRKYKFRAWDKEEKKMLSVMELGFSFNVDKYNYLAYADLDGRWGRAILTPNGGKQSYSWSGQRREAEQIEIMQYTGLLDKNEVEIYEGDIVNLSSWEPSIYQIAFDRGAFYLAKSDLEEVGDIKYAEKSEVIGNIYENPELLETK